MSSEFAVSIITPERVLYSAKATYMSVPASQGHMGILVDHAPFLSALRPGAFEIRHPLLSAPVLFKTTRGGFIEISRNTVSILLDAADTNVLPSAEKNS